MGCRGGDVERSPLHVGDEGNARVLSQPTCTRQINPARQVCVDDCDGLSIEFPLGLGAVVR